MIDCPICSPAGDQLKTSATPEETLINAAREEPLTKTKTMEDYNRHRKPCIGIDMGTSFSCVGVFRDGKVEIIANEHNNRITPSYFSFSQEGSKLFGEVAKNLVTTNPLNTIFDGKRLIGRQLSDSTMQNDQKYWPFKLVQSKEDENPKVQIDYNGRSVTISPGFIAKVILEKMKEIAESYLKEDVTNAVITVPAHFNDSQRQIIKEAALHSGLKVLRILNETSAAAVAYGVDNKIAELKKVLIFDLGGGFLDVSVICIEDGFLDVKATTSDSHLGGDDFDIQLVDHFVKEFERKHEKDLSSNPRALRLLRTACEEAKRTLSYLTQASIGIVSLYEGIDFYTTITRSCFEDLCADLFRSTLKPVEDALYYAKMDKTEINEIVLVGGSTRIPKIQNVLQDFFNGKELNESINPDEAVACGAAIQAALLCGYKSKILNDFLLLEATSHSFGIEIGGGELYTIIRRDTSIPCKFWKTFTTKNDNQSSVLIKVYEGRRKILTRENILLGQFILSGIGPAERGIPRIEITFDMDCNDILTVTAADEFTWKNKISHQINGKNTRVMESPFSNAEEMQLVPFVRKPELRTNLAD